jgi:hypothetical protein
MTAHRSFSVVAVAAVLVASMAAWPSPRDAAATGDTTFSGQATVMKGQVEGIGVGPLADTGPVSSAGGALEASLLEYPIAGVPDPTNGALSAEVFHAAVVAGGDRSHAEATVANFTVTAAGQRVGATFLAARAEAICSGSGAAVSGRVEVAELTVNGQTVTVTGGVNQTVPIPALGAIVINEQVASASAGQGSITVNALHITLTDPLTGKMTDLVVASAHADIACGLPTACSRQDFITGGGWITTTSGSKANFAVAAGTTPGWGHLLYIDHGALLKVKGTGVTLYAPGPTPTSRHIEGTDEANGVSGTYQVDVADNGQPGSDTFGIALSNGYRQPPTLLGGGNIKLHCR